jgi:hypothetical protein
LVLAHQGVQGAGVAVVALHGHRHRKSAALLFGVRWIYLLALFCWATYSSSNCRIIF